MASVCIIYATTDGHTRKICERLRELLAPAGHQVSLISIEAAGALDWSSCDKIVVGASIRYGRHNPLILDFVNAHVQLLDAKPNAFFSVNIVARKPHRNRPETNPYLQKFLKRSRWRPAELDVFAGRLDYPRYGLLDRLMIQFIMWLSRGPTDARAVVEFTDWQRVAAFAQRVARM
jgi:menaquinone-dependent protoporphyrinogen oxidase